MVSCFFFFFLKRACAGLADDSCMNSASRSTPGFLPGLLPSSSSASFCTGGKMHFLCLAIPCNNQLSMAYSVIHIHIIDIPGIPASELQFAAYLQLMAMQQKVLLLHLLHNLRWLATRSWAMGTTERKDARQTHMRCWCAVCYSRHGALQARHKRVCHGSDQQNFGLSCTA